MKILLYKNGLTPTLARFTYDFEIDFVRNSIEVRNDNFLYSSRIFVITIFVEFRLEAKDLSLTLMKFGETLAEKFSDEKLN